MFSFKRDISEFSDFEVFAVLSFIDRNNLNKYFTESEIRQYSNQCIEEPKLSLPIELENMQQVEDDQWIGVISSKQLMAMKDSQLINYDENEQRVFRIVHSGETQIKKISINNAAIGEIKSLKQRGQYIPDTITLNMPLEGSEFEYKNRTLVVYTLPNGKFNLNDGYHRYLAISRITNFYPDFEIPMELRVVASERRKRIMKKNMVVCTLAYGIKGMGFRINGFRKRRKTRMFMEEAIVPDILIFRFWLRRRIPP